MKKHLLCASFFVMMPCIAHVHPGVQESKTFMWTRPVFFNNAAEQSAWHDFIYNKPSKGGSTVQIKSMYQKSLSKERIKQYFLFGCNNELLVAGDNSNCVKNRDVRAEWLGIQNDQFSGKLTINPEQRQVGFSITAHKDISNLFDISFLQDYWVSIELPVFAVTNRLNLEQYDVHNTAATEPNDIISAFNQKKWLYAKMPKERSALNAVGLLFKFGRAFLSEDHYQIAYYSIVNVPFGGGQNAEYLFDAYAGTNQHVGFGNGVTFQILLNQDATKYAFCWFLNLEHLFLIHNKQMRTFDLIGKPWSRYMLYNKKDGAPNLLEPGVNIFTYKCRVRPYNFVEFSTGWRIISEKYECEFGYDLWGHGDERVKVLCHVDESYGIAGSNTGSIPTSASQSTIGNQADNDEDENGDPLFVPVRFSDIDITSAEGQSAINHRMHASYAYLHKGESVDGFITIGGSLEFPQKNTALHVWTVWFKVGTAM